MHWLINLIIQGNRVAFKAAVSLRQSCDCPVLVLRVSTTFSTSDLSESWKIDEMG